MPDDVNLTGKLKKIIWRSLENSFTIAVFAPEKPGLEFIATGDLFNPVRRHYLFSIRQMGRSSEIR